ncbi:ATP-binding cassette domain-containing protein [Gordonia pseudamarae]|jgi:branched-chain amino acid transport system ATP-binding protein|uniref:ATP-binding cassette domain-containing protein n=1 Tax=Gordonia pseudamarae TaxID=2831662 RepID=A0ABX6II99_9ACTN|nr:MULTISPECIES: ABC transporter ATP-binding protein [Gordonia]QHN26717.1 ATP-binding cassette domain-containing protein [Gordonia pseudamarae]QHN35610.1 ATP-binding cassette domain-containing protein [Gordonia pseudamarae]
MTKSFDAGSREAVPGDDGTPGGPGPKAPVLELRDVVIHYGRIKALHGISLSVQAGELVTLLGANGAGKSTTMRGISGLNKPTEGSIRFNGEDITTLKPHERVARGIIQVPEGRRIFPGMTVLENLDMGCYGRKFESKAAYAEALDEVFGLFPRLGERQKQYGGTMSGGEQQMLAIGRALMARPSLLLLDEPSMGLAPMVIRQIFEIIAKINATGTTILLVEQNAQQALSRSTRGYILETGSITKEGPGRELLHDDAVREAYLGVA